MKIEYSQPIILEKAQVTLTEEDSVDKDDIIEVMKNQGFDYRDTIFVRAGSGVNAPINTILVFKKETFYEPE